MREIILDKTSIDRYLQHIEGFVGDLRAEELAPSTINNHVKGVKALLRVNGITLILPYRLPKRGLAGRFRWLLSEMMRLQGIDVQELDRSLDYWEAKAEIDAKYRTKLVLKLDRLEEKMLEDPPRKYVFHEILEDLR